MAKHNYPGITLNIYFTTMASSWRLMFFSHLKQITMDTYVITLEWLAL